MDLTKPVPQEDEISVFSDLKALEFRVKSPAGMKSLVASAGKPFVIPESVDPCVILYRILYHCCPTDVRDNGKSAVLDLFQVNLLMSASVPRIVSTVFANTGAMINEAIARVVEGITIREFPAFGPEIDTPAKLSSAIVAQFKANKCVMSLPGNAAGLFEGIITDTVALMKVKKSFKANSRPFWASYATAPFLNKDNENPGDMDMPERLEQIYAFVSQLASDNPTKVHVNPSFERDLRPEEFGSSGAFDDPPFIPSSTGSPPFDLFSGGSAPGSKAKGTAPQAKVEVPKYNRLGARQTLHAALQSMSPALISQPQAHGHMTKEKLFTLFDGWTHVTPIGKMAMFDVLTMIVQQILKENNEKGRGNKQSRDTVIQGCIDHYLDIVLSMIPDSTIESLISQSVTDNKLNDIGVLFGMMGSFSAKYGIKTIGEWLDEPCAEKGTYSRLVGGKLVESVATMTNFHAVKAVVTRSLETLSLLSGYEGSIVKTVEQITGIRIQGVSSIEQNAKKFGNATAQVDGQKVSAENLIFMINCGMIHSGAELKVKIKKSAARRAMMIVSDDKVNISPHNWLVLANTWRAAIPKGITMKAVVNGDAESKLTEEEVVKIFTDYKEGATGKGFKKTEPAKA